MLYSKFKIIGLSGSRVDGMSPSGVSLDLSTPNEMENNELPKCNGMQVSQLI